jgi:hypothetical protein
VQKINIVSSTVSLSGNVTVWYDDQIATVLKYSDSATTVKSKLESAIPFIDAGNITATVPHDMDYDGNNIITITFNTVGVRKRIVVTSTLADATDTKYANVTMHTAGVNIAPDVNYLWGFYLGRKKTPALE